MSVALAVTDAHALIWYAEGKWKRLGARARRVFRDADEGRAAIFIPIIALVEIFEAARRGTIDLSGGSEAWIRDLLSTGFFFLADLTLEIVLRAESLHSIPERGDRLIAATALHLDLPLLTRDPEIGAASGVQILW